MDIYKYKEIIEKTRVYPRQVGNFGIAYCYLGLIGEFHELQSAINQGLSPKEIVGEVSDVYWYITSMATELDLDYEMIMTPDPNVYSDQSIFKLAEPIKKFYRDGKPLDPIEVENVLKNLVSALNIVAANHGFNQATALQYNYDKLMKRLDTGTIHGDGSNRENQ